MGLCLTSLPQELVINIIANVDDQISLYNLAKCSRLLYDLSLPYLYRNVNVLCGRHNEEIEDMYCQHSALYAFTCQVLQWPQRASFVKSLTLSGHVELVTDSAGLETKCSRPSPHEYAGHDRIRKVIGKLPRFKSRKAWIREIEDDLYTEGLLTILLLFLPNLEHLVTPCFDEIDSPVLSHMLYSTIERSGKLYPCLPLSKLQSLVVPHQSHQTWWDEEANGIREDQLALWLQLPPLKCVFAHMDSETLDIECDSSFSRIRNGVSQATSLQTLAKGSLGVMSISLEGADLQCQDLRTMVYACKALQELKLHWTRGREDITIHYYQYLPGYVDTPSLAAPHLETLALTYAHNPGLEEHWSSGECIVPAWNSLPQYPQLRVLKLGMIFIFGRIHLANAVHEGPDVPPNAHVRLAQTLSNLLPPNIESIHLVRTPGEDLAPILMNIENVLGQKTERFQCLKRIVAEDQFLFHKELLASRELLGSYESQDAVFELHTLARTIDVEFRMMLSEPAYRDEEEGGV